MNIKSAKTALLGLAASPAKTKNSPLSEFILDTREEIISAREAGHTWRAIYDAISPHITDADGKPVFSFGAFARRYRELRAKAFPEPTDPEETGSRKNVITIPGPISPPASYSPKLLQCLEKNFILGNGDVVSRELVDRLAELFLKGLTAQGMAEVLNGEGWEPVVGTCFTPKSVLALIDLCGSTVKGKEHTGMGVPAGASA
jgi:hypothetical protein